MFKWLLTKCIKYRRDKFYPLVNLNPINWIRASLGKTKKIQSFRVPSLIGKLTSDVKKRYDFFQTLRTDDIWVLTEKDEPCRLVSYRKDGFINFIALYTDTTNINWLIRSCWLYALKHKYVIFIKKESSSVWIASDRRDERGCVISVK